MTKGCCYAKLHVWSLGLALGIVWGAAILITGLVAMVTGWGEGFVETMRTIYIGYTSSIVGSLIGALWGAVDMFITGVILAALYNLFLCCCRRNDEHCEIHKAHRNKKTV